MEVVPFIADSAADALAQIRGKLGPEAVVLNVRQLPASGLSRLWQKARIEVLACAPAAKQSDALADLRQEIAQLKEKLPARTGLAPATNGHQDAPAKIDAQVSQEPGPAVGGSDQRMDGGWRTGEMLQTMGVLPVYAHRVVEEMRKDFGTVPPETLGEELTILRSTLGQMWKKPMPVEGGMAHVFIGPLGTGKTTCICKWLTQAVLLEGKSALAFRLDGRVANTAESLGVYCEILGVPVERAWTLERSASAAERVFIDLPGVDWRDATAVGELGQRLKEFPAVQANLVLNAAYETPLLLAQLRAFAALPVADLVFTHLDEEARWGKLWNFVLGTEYAMRFLSAGQNIPGNFFEATPELVLAHQFPRPGATERPEAACAAGVGRASAKWVWQRDRL